MAIDPQLLEQFEALAPVGEEGRARMAPMLKSTTYRTGAQIVREGDEGDACYLLAEGRVVVTKNLNFTGKSLLSAQVARAIEDLRGGSVVYALSANGGKTWTTVAAGKDVLFAYTGADLRLKVSFTNKSLDPLSLMGVLVSYKTK